MYFGRKYYDQAALVSIMIFNEGTLAMNASAKRKKVCILHTFKWNLRWCGRFRPLQSFPCTA